LGVIEYCLLVGHKFLFQGAYADALPPGMQALRFSEEHYGNNSMQLVEPYLILAEAKIGLQMLKEAETYLAQAQWTTIKAKCQVSLGILSKLNRKLAQLFEAKCDYNSALECLAQDIYYSSCEHGPSHIETAGGYFSMARVYYKIHNQKDPAPPKQLPPVVTPSNYCDRVRQVERNCSLNEVVSGVHAADSPVIIADDLYARVIAIWAEFMVDLLLKRQSEREAVPDMVKQTMRPTEVNLSALCNLADQAQCAELGKVLCEVQLHYRHRIVNDKLSSVAPNAGRPDAVTMLSFAFGFFHLLQGDEDKSRTHMKEAILRKEQAEKHVLLDKYEELLSRQFLTH
ncbi:Zinc finger MYND domain-containing protein 12, partial [Cichlidogyrus casuarinus]